MTPPSRNMPGSGLNMERQKKDTGNLRSLFINFKEVVKIAEFIFPRDAGWKIIWIFDHSSCHAAMPKDALVVSKMNVNPGRQMASNDGWMVGW